jgi:hypothetical protein
MQGDGPAAGLTDREPNLVEEIVGHSGPACDGGGDHPHGADVGRVRGE